MKVDIVYDKKEDKYKEAIIFNADDEEPDCMKCRYVQNDDMCNQCGNFWKHYERIEILDCNVKLMNKRS